MRHDRIIQLFGGTSALARLVVRDPGSVSRWKQNGIPPNLWKTLMQIADKRGIALSYDQFIDGYPNAKHYRTYNGRYAAARNGVVKSVGS